jgi:adenine-specific DNA-methyltransferase
MEKMDGRTKDIVAENVGRLKELFPEAFTEGKVDFEALKEVLGTFVDDRDERYSFTWNGKSKARMIAQTPSTGTLRPCKDESVDWDTTQNIFIEGDNLEVLKLLQKSYHKKVKMIYIDPPYNTGKDFVYKDNFKDNIKNYKEITGQVDNEGRNLSNNPETSGRYHTDWLNMMYPRLKLARNLLKDDGVIFISIDDNEVSNLRKMCDEIFGEENFVAELIWKSRQNKDNRNITGASIDHEYIICFSKTNNLKALRGADRDNSQYTNPDNDYRGDWASGNMVGLLPQDQRPNCHYDLINTKTDINYGKPEMGWRYDQSTMSRLIEEDRIIWPTSQDGRPRRKVFLNELTDPYTGYSSLVGGNIYTRNGTAETENIFEKRLFDFPKPTVLLTDIVEQGSGTDGLVLDFFSGSSSTAHAVLKLNVQKTGNRKFIMVQLPETTDEKSEAFKAGYKTIAEISKERIRRAAAKIKEELTTKDTKDTRKEESEDLFSVADKENFREVRASNLPDLGFKIFKLDSTNIKPWEVDFDMTERTLEDFISNIKPARREEDVLYEILLKYGLDLTLPISEHTIAGQKVFDIGMGALIICLADSISLEVVEGMAKLKEELNPEIMRVVFKDSGFKDDVVKTNAVQILKQAGIVDVRSL